jgi:hypothetical protein
MKSCFPELSPQAMYRERVTLLHGLKTFISFKPYCLICVHS